MTYQMQGHYDVSDACRDIMTYQMQGHNDVSDAGTL